MADPNLMAAGAALADHLRAIGVRNPVVGAGSQKLFVYALRRDKRLLSGLSEWLGHPVTISYGGKIRPLAA